jgi:hypothetical protein
MADRNKLRHMIKKRKQRKGCVNCGSHQNLTYHHIDPDSKVDTINNLARNGASAADIRREMQKCIILCTTCHRNLHGLVKEN